MGASHSVSWDASAGRSSRDGPVLVITANALKQLTTQIEEQTEEKVHGSTARQGSPSIEDSGDTASKREELQMLEKFWSNRLEVYKQQNEELKQRLESINRVEFLPAPRLSPQLTEDPGSEGEQRLRKCLQQNSQQPLKCCREVREFVRSVSQA